MKYVVDKQEKLTKSIIHSIKGVSFSDAQKYLRLGRVKVNNARVKKDMQVQVGDSVEVFVMELKGPKVDILYEDEHILVANKPNGMEVAVVDKTDEKDITLEEYLASHKVMVVHRLDRLTEGIVIFAKSNEAKVLLDKSFKERLCTKVYVALVYGTLAKTHDVMSDYLVKDSDSSTVKIFNTAKPNSKEIVTEYEVIEKLQDFTKVKVTLHTGRTHQIRAHMSFIGHPVVNDSKYELKKYSDITPPTKYRGYYLTATSFTFNCGGMLSYLDGKSFTVTPSWDKGF